MVLKHFVFEPSVIHIGGRWGVAAVGVGKLLQGLSGFVWGSGVRLEQSV